MSQTVISAVGQSFSYGKKDADRNDDFVFVRNIFKSLLLGVVGDFTSDSSRGINDQLCLALGDFVDERSGKWREYLVDPRDIVHLVARFVNRWLLDQSAKARTTLVSLTLDTRTGCCHYSSIGDSGLAVIGPVGLRFLVKGDVSGVRDATGFLPLAQETWSLKEELVAADEVVFAFTDGFWENTRGRMAPQDCEQLLRQMLLGDDVGKVLPNHLLSISSGKDDLTMLVVNQQMVPLLEMLSPEIRAARMIADAMAAVHLRRPDLVEKLKWVMRD